MASGHWLLPAAPVLEDAHADWKNKGSAWLRPGVLFGAVTAPASLIHAALGLDDPVACAPPLAEGLEGGPVFYHPEGFGREGSYVALLPASVGLAWGVQGSLSHPYRALLQVPAPDVIEPQEDGPWWVVPLDGPGLLCPPDRLAALVNLGREAKARAAAGAEEAGGDE
ncbi:hypothetical protein ACFWXA_30935 [Streptomyces atroolivaceus]|uniref:hypothetical protein n=1 Tax=Streptomyces atroolivaceus TaxID=66869 RepID=UPI00365252CF